VPNNNKGIQSRKVNSDWQRGCSKGQQQRRKDAATGVYPRSGLPVSDDNPAEWVRGYQASYYQGAPDNGDPAKVEVVVRVDRTTFNSAQNIDKSQWAELGWRIAAAGIDQALLSAWADDIGGHFEGADGWTILDTQGRQYTAPTPFEALLLMLADLS
jgi:hypothetical protein